MGTRGQQARGVPVHPSAQLSHHSQGGPIMGQGPVIYQRLITYRLLLFLGHGLDSDGRGRGGRLGNGRGWLWLWLGGGAVGCWGVGRCCSGCRWWSRCMHRGLCGVGEETSQNYLMAMKYDYTYTHLARAYLFMPILGFSPGGRHFTFLITRFLPRTLFHFPIPVKEPRHNREGQLQPDHLGTD